MVKRKHIRTIRKKRKKKNVRKAEIRKMEGKRIEKVKKGGARGGVDRGIVCSIDLEPENPDSLASLYSF